MGDDTRIRSQPGRTTVMGWHAVRELPPHSAFGCSWDVDEEAPEDVGPGAALLASSEAVPVDRSCPDDLERAEDEVVVLLAGAVDEVCLQVLLREAREAAEDVAAADLQRWLVEATRQVTTAAHQVCDADLLLDVELREHVRIARQSRRRVLDAGWCVADLSLMSRGADGARCAVVVRPHLVELTGPLEVSIVSTQLPGAGPGSEWLHGQARFAYAPRLSLHPGQLRIARVQA